MEFEELIKVLGSIILSLTIVALPVLCGLSYGFNWYGGIQLFFTMMTFGEAVILWAVMWRYLEGN